MMVVTSVALVVCMVAAGPNAADEYRKLSEMHEELAQADLDELAWLQTCVQNGYPLSDAEAARLEELQGDMLEVVERATSHEVCDFELPYEEEGFELLIPHLSHMLGAARQVAASAGHDLVITEGRGLADHLERIGRISQHLASDDLIISSFVAMGADSRTERLVESAIERGLIDARQAARVLAALPMPDARDPYRIAAAVANEQRIISAWLPAQISSNTRSADDTAESLGLPSGSFPDMDEAQAKVFVGEMAGFYEEVIAGLNNPDREAGLEQIEDAERGVDRGRYGILAKVLAPAVSNMVTRRNEAIAARSALRTRLGDIAEGRVSPVSQTNAAWVWIRAARYAAHAEGDWWADADRANDIEFMLMESLQCPTKQYPPPWSGYLEPTVPWWLPGQDLLLQGLLTRARQGLSGGRVEQAVMQLTIVLTMTEALAESRRIAPAIEAAGVLDALVPIIMQATVSGVLNATHSAGLRDRVAALSRRDGAGLLGALEATRGRFGVFLNDNATLAESGADSRVPPDGMLPIIAWQRGWMSRAHPDVHVVPSGDGAALHLARIDAPTLDTWYTLGQGGAEPLGFDDMPPTDLAALGTSSSASVQAIRDALEAHAAPGGVNGR